MLPHAYPFRLVEGRADGSVWVLVTIDAAWSRGVAELPRFLAVEALAQSAILALAGSGEAPGAARGGLLAGLDDVRFVLPLMAGDRLEARATLLGRLGPLVKVRGELRRDGEIAVEADLLLALTPAS